MDEQQVLDSFPIEVGRSQYGDQVVIDFIAEASHIAIQGKTRSGKSQVSYNLLASAATCPAIRVVGVDPTSVLLRPFVENGEKRIHLGTSRFDGAVDVLRWVKEVSDERIERMWEARVDKYSAVSAVDPLILVVLEELPGIIEGAADEDSALGRRTTEKAAAQFQALFRQLAAQSAKAGIRLLALSQRAEATVFTGSARSNFATKFSLRLDEPESLRMLHPNMTGDEIAQVEAFPPGQGYFESPSFRRDIIRSLFVGEYARYADAVLRSRHQASLPECGEQGQEIRAQLNPLSDSGGSHWAARGENRDE